MDQGEILHAQEESPLNLAQKKLSKLYGDRAAEIILAVTKPKIDGVEITTKEESRARYRFNLMYASPEALLVKMADRLHNLRTLGARKLEDQEKVLRETREIYFPIFERVLNAYPQEGEYLFKMMEQAMNQATIFRN